MDTDTERITCSFAEAIAVPFSWSHTFCFPIPGAITVGTPVTVTYRDDRQPRPVDQRGDSGGPGGRDDPHPRGHLPRAGGGG